jgi:hypothetical protein
VGGDVGENPLTRQAAAADALALFRHEGNPEGRWGRREQDAETPSATPKRLTAQTENDADESLEPAMETTPLL